MDVSNLSARDLMQKEVQTVPESTSILKAAKQMRDLNVSSLVVEPRSKTDAFGMITRKDMVDALMAMISGDIPTTVAHHMSKPAITANPDLSIELCYRLMKMIGIRRMPVVEGNTLLGVLSNTDLYKALANDIA